MLWGDLYTNLHKIAIQMVNKKKGWEKYVGEIGDKFIPDPDTYGLPDGVTTHDGHITTLDISDMEYEEDSLTLPSCPKLSVLIVFSCELKRLQNIPESVRDLSCSNNNLETLSLTHLSTLQSLDCSNNKLIISPVTKEQVLPSIKHLFQLYNNNWNDHTIKCFKQWGLDPDAYKTNKWRRPNPPYPL